MSKTKSVDNSTTVDLENLAIENSSDNTDDGMNEFFTTLEKQVDGAIFDDQKSDPPNTEDGKSDQEDSSVSSPDSETEKMKKELETLKKRYSSSSTEGKRLRKELDEFESYKQYVPILKAMREDPNLVHHVSNYLEGNAGSKSFKEGLGLPEDFVFDGDEAFSDSNSDSAKLLDASLDAVVSRKMQSLEARQTQQSIAQRQQDSIKSKFNMNDDELNDLIGWAKSQKLTLEDIYYLKNRENREKEIATSAIEDKTNQLKKMSGVSRSLASTGEGAKSVDQDEEVFNAIKKAVDQGGIFPE